IDILRGIAKREPTHEATHALLLDLYQEVEEPDSVLAELDRWARARESDLDAWTRDARAQAMADGPDAARRALEAAEHADYLAGGKDPELLELRASALEKLGDPAEATRLRGRAAAASQHHRG